MREALTQLDSPIDVMYPIHKALRAEAAHAETLARSLALGGNCEPFRQAFLRWATALEYHAVMENTHMTAALDRPSARTNEAEHQQLTELLGDLHAYVQTVGQAAVTERARRHLLGKVVALRVAQDDHLEEEEERILPVIKEYIRTAQQQEMAQRLLIDQDAQEPGWVLAWLTPYITATERQLLTELTAQSAVLHT
jgi:hypothetical protein